MASKRSVERRERALSIVRCAIRLVETRGEAKEIERSPGKCIGFEEDSMLILWMKTDGTSYPENGLDIWDGANGKFFRTYWSNGKIEDVEIGAFKRGPWEEKMLALSPLH